LEEIKEGRFREDLYYRLNVICISVPPLRERRDDIPLLVNHFINDYNKMLNKNIRNYDDKALAVLLDYDWPGNIRELRNVIERTALLSNSELITTADIPLEIAGTNGKLNMAKINVLDPMPLDRLINLYTKNILSRYKNNKTKAASTLGITRQRLRRILNASQTK